MDGKYYLFLEPPLEWLDKGAEAFETEVSNECFDDLPAAQAHILELPEPTATPNPMTCLLYAPEEPTEDDKMALRYCDLLKIVQAQINPVLKQL